MRVYVLENIATRPPSLQDCCDKRVPRDTQIMMNVQVCCHECRYNLGSMIEMRSNFDNKKKCLEEYSKVIAHLYFCRRELESIWHDFVFKNKPENVLVI